MYGNCSLDSKIFSSTVIRDLGELLEELIRHYPQLMHFVVDAVVDNFAVLIARGFALLAKGIDEPMSIEYLIILQRLTGSLGS